MKAIRFDGTLKYVQDAPLPVREGETLVRVVMAGICNTDLEITKGYAGFRGTLGHEFVGRVEESSDGALTGRRVVGEINAGCNLCDLCRAGDSRHCSARTVLGIHNRDGAFAEFLSLPSRNLVEVPDAISNEEAVFIEPLAAACQILQQVRIDKSSRVAVIGDGKLAQLVVRSLAASECRSTLIGKHEGKLKLARHACERVALAGTVFDEKFDTVIEASGSASGLDFALDIVRPRGTVVLKSTHHGATPLDTAKAVVNEITLVGSRCGRFQPALDLLASRSLDVRPLISDCLSIDDGPEAFHKAALSTSMKVLLRVNDF